MNRKLLYSIGIGFLVGILLATVFLPLVENPLIGLGIGVVIGVIAYFLQNRAENGAGSILSIEPNAYKTLLDKARGDKSLAERLMRYEQKTQPDASRAELAKRALERWERDSR